MKTYIIADCIKKGVTYYGKTIMKHMELDKSELIWALENDNLYTLKHYNKKTHANNCGLNNPYPDADNRCTCGAE